MLVTASSAEDVPGLPSPLPLPQDATNKVAATAMAPLPRARHNDLECLGATIDAPCVVEVSARSMGLATAPLYDTL